MKKYLEPEELAEVKKLDLLTYLYNYEPNELVKNGRNDYTTRTHSSLHISNGLWTWWAHNIGGRSALDYLIKVENMDFLPAALLIHECITKSPPVEVKQKSYKNGPYTLKLPMANENAKAVYDYLIGQRKIDQEIIDFYYVKGMIYESFEDHAVIFVGLGEGGIPKFASKRSTDTQDKQNIFGSNKQYSFHLVNKNSEILNVFESAIDLMSWQTIQKIKGYKWNTENYLSLDGATLIGKSIEETEIPVALEHFLQCNKNIKQISLYMDNDKAGYDTVEKIKYHLMDRYDIVDNSPKKYKDINEKLQKMKGKKHLKCI